MGKKKFLQDFSVTSTEPVIQEIETGNEIVNVENASVNFTEPETEEPEVEAIVNGVDTALNIRKKPEVKPNNQIGIVGKGSKIVVVDPEKTVKKNGEEWYKVKLNGQPGYAMKKYIKVI